MMKSFVEKITVRIPATIANLGPGFDCLGIALDIYNELTLARSDKSALAVSGEGSNSIPLGKGNKIFQSIIAFYREIGRMSPELSISAHNNIPLARGLGSSATVIVGGLMAANILEAQPLSDEGLFSLAVQLEGHADNVAPALFGGGQLVIREDNRWLHFSFPLPVQLKVVLFIPDFEMPTDKARAILAPEVSREEAVYNLGRVALLMLALTEGRPDYLGLATQDKLHQPQRQALFPAMEGIFKSALEAGAWGAFLSGAGSTIAALVTKKAQDIGEAMSLTARKAGINGKIRITQPSSIGAHQVIQVVKEISDGA
jgi:homoserine kinase